MSDPTRSDARENACPDPVSIDAVAAVIGDVWEVFDAGLNEDGFPERGMRTRSPESIARALAGAGWLRTAEEREAASEPLPAFEDDPVAMRLGFTPTKPGVLLPGTPEHCHRCALDEVERLRLRTAEDRAVLDAAEAETDAERSLHGHEDLPKHRENLYIARDARRAAVRARRVAAGGTEAQP